MIRAVLFDAVGTLIHLREPVGETYARVARAHGIVAGAAALAAQFPSALRAMPPMVFPERAGAVRRQAERDWWRTVVARTFGGAGAPTHGERFEHCFAALFDHFGSAAAWQLADGALETLAGLRNRGVRTGMVSNFDHRLPSILRTLGLAPLLEIVVLPADAGAAKPQAPIFEYALERLQVAPAEVLYVGDDAEHDIAGARGVGLQAVDVATLGDVRELLLWV